MTLLNWLIHHYKVYIGKEFHTLLTNYEVTEILKKKYDVEIIISDERYKTGSFESCKNLLSLSPIKKLTYLPEYRDCDDMAFNAFAAARFLVPGFCFGCAWVKLDKNTAHLLNFFIDKNKSLNWFEPQTNKIWCGNLTVYRWLI